MAEAKVSRTQQAFNNIDLIVKKVSMSRVEHLALVDDIVHLKNTIDEGAERVTQLVAKLDESEKELEESKQKIKED